MLELGLLFLLVLSGILGHGMVLNAFRMDLHSLITLLWKHLHKCIDVYFHCDSKSRQVDNDYQLQ